LERGELFIGVEDIELGLIGRERRRNVLGDDLFPVGIVVAPASPPEPSSANEAASPTRMPRSA
jgi:hypothetical protein